MNVRNNGKADVAVSHVGIPTEPFAVEIRDESGKVVPYSAPERDTLGVSTVTVSAGESETVELYLHKSHFENRVWPVGKLTVVVRLTIGEKVYESKPLVMQ